LLVPFSLCLLTLSFGLSPFLLSRTILSELFDPFFWFVAVLAGTILSVFFYPSFGLSLIFLVGTILSLWFLILSYGLSPFLLAGTILSVLSHPFFC
jgi:hypothetical protein